MTDVPAPLPILARDKILTRDAACRSFPIDRSRSYVVGDKISGIEFAHNAGVKAVFVLSGYGLGEYEHHRDTWRVQPDHIAKDLKEAVSWILKD